MARKLAVVAPVEAPKPVTGEMILDNLVKHVLYNLDYAKGTLTKFAASFQADPAYALAWSRDAFVAAARTTIAKDVANMIEHLRKAGDEYVAPDCLSIVRAVRTELSRVVLHTAKYPDRSTSPQSNDMSLCLNSMRVEWLDKIDSLLARVA